MHRRKPRLFFLLLVTVSIWSCGSKNLISTESISATFSDAGQIISIHSGGKNISTAVKAYTSLDGCRLEGSVKKTESADGSISFERTLISDSAKASCTVIDKFYPSRNTIRWVVLVTGKDNDWSAPIQTVLEYPADENTRWWTSWGRPKFDSAADPSLKERLRPVRGATPETAIFDDANRDWVDPLIPVPFTNDTVFYGAPPPFSYKNSLVSAEWTFFRQLFSVPLVTITNAKEKTGTSLILSPENDLISMTMETSAAGKIQFSRLFNRIRKNDTVRFDMDLLTTADDWRPALKWMSERYPDYFNPVNPDALQLNGSGAYSNYYQQLDTSELNRFAFTVNWQASFDFPYMGMFLPPVKSHTRWKRFGGGGMSVNEMNGYASSMRKLGYHVLNYFNVTEFGTAINYPAAADTNQNSADSWKDANRFLYQHFPDAILLYRDRFDSTTTGGIPFHTWRNALVMDAGDPAYSRFLLEQARRHVNEIPDASGICIDRLDWLNIFNIRADDGISFFEGNKVRSIGVAYKNLMDSLGPVFHGSKKFILANGISRRLDYFKHLDGIFDEFTYAGTPLNTAAFISINKPALGWTDNSQTVLREGGDQFFQKYLYMGVFPMCPYPGNDHSLNTNDTVKKIYSDYGPLMKLIQKRSWYLEPHPVALENNLAKANVFKLPDGYAIPVVYGKDSSVKLTLNLELKPGSFSTTIHFPGNVNPCRVEPRAGADGSFTLQVPLVRGCGLVIIRKSAA